MSNETDKLIVMTPKAVQPEPPKSERTLMVAHVSCLHDHFQVCDSAAEVTCGKCGEKLNPMWVLQYLARSESLFKEELKYAQAELRLTAKRIAEKKRAKCQHCGKMTEVRVDLTIREIQGEQHGN